MGDRPINSDVEIGTKEAHIARVVGWSCTCSASRLWSWSILIVAVCVLNAYNVNTILAICSVHFIEYSEPTLYICFKQLFDISTYMSWWVVVPPPPNKNSGYSGGSASRLLSWIFLSLVAVCILNACSVNTIHTICSVFIEYSEPALYIFWKQLFAISTYMSCDFAHCMVSMWCNSCHLVAFDRWHLEWHMYKVSSTWMHFLKLNIVATNFAAIFWKHVFYVIY